MHLCISVISRTEIPLKRGCLLVFICLFFNNSLANDVPWRMNDALALPAWLSISGQHRTRYETLDEQFRVGRNGDDQILVFRTNILTEIMIQNWKLGFEVLDARQSHAKDDTPIGTGTVNPTDVLQAFVQWQANRLFNENSISNFKIGRFTIDVGSRRFVARNLFRNTINAFTGIDWQWFSADGTQFRAFYTLPVNRLPRERDRLTENRSEGDDEDTAVKFWGLYYRFSNRAFADWKSKAELFYFGLDENDTHNRPTRNRDLHTFGGRLFKAANVNEFDFQIEAAVQFGESRSSAAVANTNDLDHFAYFYRMELGYKYNAIWSPRLSAQFDFASGDEDSDDDDNNRFDTLFGARRFDFGPTGIYGPFVRANLVSPGISLRLNPSPRTSWLFAHRGYWLASKKDAWVVAGVQDPQGDSGRFIGQQSEIRYRFREPVFRLLGSP